MASATPDVEPAAALELEQGHVLFFPDLPFPVTSEESALFSPAILASAKNASFDPRSQRVAGTTLQGPDLDRLHRLLARFSDASASLVEALFPHYRASLRRARASFRPAEIAGRASSWRKDDTRLHVDSFPANPVQGQRILRVFSNVNPAGNVRTWRIGDAFETLAERFASQLSIPMPFTAPLLQALRVTRTRRTAYDALMLQLHDCMKQDADYQSARTHQQVDFPSGSTWIAFTDQVSHAALSGQFQLEQTFLLPVHAMIDERTAPLRVLERLKGRALV